MTGIYSYCVKSSFTLKEVIEIFEDHNERVAIVTNYDDKVVGVISQGDILRALASGQNLYCRVDDVIKGSFLHLYERDMLSAYNIFKKKRITLLPILSTEGKLVDVITLQDIFDYLDQQK